MNDTHRGTRFPAPPQPANDIRLARPIANASLESCGKPFDCLGQTWIVLRAWSVEIGGMPHFDIVDMKTGRSAGRVAAPNVAAARILAISAMTMLPAPGANGVNRAQDANGANHGHRPHRAAERQAEAATGLPLREMAACERLRTDARQQAARGAA